MFGMGTTELIVILLIALIFIGPKKLPEIARAIGKGLGELRKATDGIKSSMNVNTAFHQFMSEEDENPPKSEQSNGVKSESAPNNNSDNDKAKGDNQTNNEEK